MSNCAATSINIPFGGGKAEHFLCVCCRRKEENPHYLNSKINHARIDQMALFLDVIFFKRMLTQELLHVPFDYVISSFLEFGEKQKYVVKFKKLAAQ